METIDKFNAVCVLTARGIESILEDGGSQAWVLDAKRARKCEYVICVQNRGFVDDWGHASADHHVAFLIGRLKDVVRSKEENCEKRWVLTFSEYAEINIPNAWPGFRNPVFYTNLKHFGIDPQSLKFEPMPSVEPLKEAIKTTKPMTMAEAKQGLAITFSVAPSDIEIIVRG
jgi:hypothetical protein